MQFFNKKIYYFIIILLTVIAFGYRTISYEYGLPYLTNSDEGSLIKATLYFFNLLSKSSPAQLSNEPIYGAFLNFLFSGFILFFEQLITLDFNFALIPLEIYFDPSIFIRIGRLSSIIANSLTILIFSILIFKIKLLLFDKILIILLLCFSYSQIEISQVYGKNSYAALFFLTQIVLILNYFDNKILNLKKILLLSFVSAIGFGINYISALPTLLFLFTRFLNKEKRNLELKLYIYYSFFFVILIIPALFVNDYPFYRHFFNTEGREMLFPNETKFQIIFKNIKEYFFLILNFETPLIIIIILAIINYKKINSNEKNKLIFLFIVVFFTLLIFCLADYSKPSVRYFALITPVIYIILCIVFSSLNKKKIVILRVITVLMISFNLVISTTVILKANKKQTQYLALDFIIQNNIDSKKTVVHFNELIMRESIYSLNTNIQLLNEEIIKVAKIARGRNTIDKLKNKKVMIKKFPNLIKSKFEGFIMTNGTEVINYSKFLNKLKNLNYQYYIIDDNKLLRTQEKKELLKELNINYHLIHTIDANDILYRRNIKNIKDIFNLERFGPKILIYKL